MFFLSTPVIPLLFGLAILIVKVLLGDIERSKDEVKLTRLIQRVAILEKRLEDAQPQKKNPDT